MAPNARASAEKASPMMMEYERHARIGVTVHASGTRKAVRSPTALAYASPYDVASLSAQSRPSE